MAEKTTRVANNTTYNISIYLPVVETEALSPNI